MVRNFRDLEVWRKSHELARAIFDLADTFPRKYLVDLTSQLRRAALSVPTNIAEGYATSHSKELVQFLNIAKRSVSEVQYLLFFAFESQLLDQSHFGDLDARYEEINRMLGGLKRSLSERAINLSTHHSALLTRH